MGKRKKPSTLIPIMPGIDIIREAQVRGSRKTPNPSKLKNRQPQRTEEEIGQLKEQIVALVASGEAENISQACRQLEIDPISAYRWEKTDKTFKEDVVLAQQVVADRLEEDLDRMNNPLARIFRLKKLRPEYRDNAPQPVSSNFQELLKELKKAGQEKSNGEVDSKSHKEPGQLNQNSQAGGRLKLEWNNLEVLAPSESQRFRENSPESSPSPDSQEAALELSPNEPEELNGK